MCSYLRYSESNARARQKNLLDRQKRRLGTVFVMVARVYKIRGGRGRVALTSPVTLGNKLLGLLRSFPESPQTGTIGIGGGGAVQGGGRGLCMEEDAQRRWVFVGIYTSLITLKLLWKAPETLCSRQRGARAATRGKPAYGLICLHFLYSPSPSLFAPHCEFRLY